MPLLTVLKLLQSDCDSPPGRAHPPHRLALPLLSPLVLSAALGVPQGRLSPPLYLALR
jgi:hypothetical protein